MIKTIFLDIDGVLHSFSDYENDSEFTKIQQLKALCKSINNNHHQIKIVITSMRRLHDSMDNIVQALQLHDFNIEYDKTTSIKAKIGDVVKNKFHSYDNRFSEILNYIQNNQIDSNDYVIFDDDEDCFFREHVVQQIHNIEPIMKNGTILDKWKDNAIVVNFMKHFVYVNDGVGLTNDDVNKAKDILQLH